jgi:hypothetical protein
MVEMVEMVVVVVVLATMDVISEVKSWLLQRSAEWYREVIQALASWWSKAINLEGNYVGK